MTDRENLIYFNKLILKKLRKYSGIDGREFGWLRQKNVLILSNGFYFVKIKKIKSLHFKRLFEIYFSAKIFSQDSELVGRVCTLKEAKQEAEKIFLSFAR